MTRRAGFTVLCALALVACGARGTRTATTLSPSMVDPYLKIQAGLAGDTLDAVRANAGDVASAAAAVGAPAAKIDAAARKLATASTLVEARALFGALSDEMLAYMKAASLTPPEGVRVAYCDMVNKPWLQRGKTIANPYFGSDMLTCGEFR